MHDFTKKKKKKRKKEKERKTKTKNTHENKNKKTRSAQIKCVVFTCVAKPQLLLRANDIERNPAPDPDVETFLQGLFIQQEVKQQTLFGQQLEREFQTLENKLCAKIDWL